MGRIRTIKPEFPQSESMGRVSREARLLFIMLWTVVDDSGRTRAASRMLASLLYPYDDDAPKLLGKWMKELERENCVVRYQVDGQSYLEICKWLNHQKIDRPTKSKLPPLDESSRGLDEDSTTDLDQDQDQDQGEDQGKERNRSRKLARVVRPDDVSEEVWTSFLELRRAKRAPVTDTAMRALRSEAAAARINLQDVLEMCCARGWAGFKAEWIQTKSETKSRQQKADDAWDLLMGRRSSKTIDIEVNNGKPISLGEPDF